MDKHQDDGHPHRYKVTVSSSEYTFDDPILQGRQLLSSAGYDPADEHVLIQLLKHETRSISLDESVDLRADGIEAFRAFRSDRVFRFTLNERGCEWGAAAITESELRAIAKAGEGEVLVLDRTDEESKDLAPDDEVVLAEAGTEHIRTAKRLVTVFFKNKPIELPREVYTTEQLIGLFPIEEGYLLNLKDGDDLIPLNPGEHIRLKEGMYFYSQVPGGGSS